MNSGDKKTEFEELRQKVFDYVMEDNPVLATNMGLHEYDDQLPDGSRSSREETIAKFNKWKSKLENINQDELTNEEADSLRFGKHVLGLRLFELEELRFWESNPGQPQVVGSSLLPLLKRNFAPLEDRLRSAIARINQIPEFLDSSKDRIDDPVELWVKMSKESLEKLPGLLEVVKKTTAESDLGKEEQEKLEEAVVEARKSFEDFGNWLEKISQESREGFAIGRGKFEKLLEKQKLGYGIDEIMDLGKKYLEESRGSMEKYSRRINEDYSVKDALGHVEENTPKDFSKALTWYKGAIEEAKDYVERKNLATLPENEDITVMETPSYLRHVIPFAAYIPPAKYDDDREGVYLVTPPEDEEELSRFAFWSIRNTTVHEGYPGHHLQMSASVESDDLFALLSHATETIEGWAHYCEEMMKDYGFDDTPEARLIQLKDRRWRAARIIADVKLSTGKFSYREGVEYMADTVRMDEKSAEAEVKRYTQNPSYQLSYLLGKHKLGLLREHVKKIMGGDYRDRFFHDQLIYGGSIPIKFHRDRFNRLVEQGDY
ncbi:MAG: DUF885 domain-containing protein [Candidatus Bipolaricaulota bacterium]|nr:DUF885 domain-containing protein [Candidatus Bipolaricaulota bacterium]MBS3791654.1 DUF885 domain-containing protein [Candidatus Bipolaricaulota bacterium]